MDTPTQSFKVIAQDQGVRAIAKTFASGSVGWFLTGKVELLDGDLAGERVQISGTAVVIGSKDR